MIIADQHLHTSYSTDSEASMKDMVEKAISLGLKQINFTDHNDFGFPEIKGYENPPFVLNVDSYLYSLLSLREQYKDIIQIGFGIELGLMQSVFRQNAVLTRSHDFDFIIASIHLVRNIDTYDKSLYEGKTVNESFNEYYDTLLNNIKQFQNFDVLGHLDCLTINLPNKETGYYYLDYLDKTDEIFNILIENEKGLELNTKALARGLNNPNPCPDLLKRYRELGGEIITIGSDAHSPEGIASHFNVAEDILKACGFKYYSVFKDRVAHYEKL